MYIVIFSSFKDIDPRILLDSPERSVFSLDSNSFKVKNNYYQFKKAKIVQCKFLFSNCFFFFLMFFLQIRLSEFRTTKLTRSNAEML